MARRMARSVRAQISREIGARSVDALALDEVAQAPRRGLAGGDLCGDVAEDRLGQADVGADHGLEVRDWAGPRCI